VPPSDAATDAAAARITAAVSQELRSALTCLDELLGRAVATARRLYGDDAVRDPCRGLYVSHDQAVDLLARTPATPLLYTKDEAREATYHGHDGRSRLLRLKQLFGLGSLDIDLLLIGLAPELDLKYERLYAYLQDDVTRKRPSVDLALNLLCSSPEEKLAARQLFAPTAPLLRHELLHLFREPSQLEPPLLGRYIKVDDRVVEYLLGSDAVAGELVDYARLVVPQRRFEDLLFSGDFGEAVRRLVAGAAAEPGGYILYFQGPYGVGKQSVAEALCDDLGIRLLAVDGVRLAGTPDGMCSQLLRKTVREAVLQEAAIYWQGFDVFLAEERRSELQALQGELEKRRGLTFLSGNVTWEPSDGLPLVPFVRLEFPKPAYPERLGLWKLSLNGGVGNDAGLDLEALANKFRFSGGQIQDAAATARSLARARDPQQARVTMADLCAACRLQSNRKLARLATKVAPRYGWSDIVLPADRLEQLREITNYMKYRALVYHEWGFDRKLAMGKGLNVLFSGPSGTGKTMAAEIIAAELDLDLYRIDLSTVVSKYIGETEKNLSRIFAEAESSNAILFFDEADALFGRRTEVRDAHDRYANLEVSYLLQKMEEYEGVVILATNLRKNMDEAFVRRMHFTVEFPFPGVRERQRIWEAIWPAALPRDPALSGEVLAQRLELAGGSIRNIALAAAFLAAADGRVVTHQHLARAARREYQKMGKVISDTEFRVHGP
jgi:AAA+ superfamily predicted ATPase